MTDKMQRTLVVRLHAREADTTAQTVPCTLSSEFPVRREWGDEVLDHSPESIDMSRASEGLPLLEGHDVHAVNVGVVESIKIVGRKLRGLVRFGKSQRARELFQDVVDGVVRNLSVGYSIDDLREEGDVVRVTRWTPHELSIVGSGADPNSGFFRAREITMSDESGSDLEVLKSTRKQRREAKTAVESERERVQTILDLKEDWTRESNDPKFTRNVAERMDAAISNGEHIEDVRAWLLEEIGRRGDNMPVGLPPRPQSDAVIPRRSEYFERSNYGVGPQREYSLTRAISSLINPAYMAEAGYEVAISRDMMRKHGERSGLAVPLNLLGSQQTRAVTYAGEGADLVATQHMAADFIDVLRNRSVVMGRGPTRLSGLTGNLSIPRQTKASSAAWIALDGTSQISESTPEYDTISLEPHSLAGLVTISYRLLQQGQPSLEQLVRDDLAATLATGLDAAALSGSGSGAEPAGILGATGVGTDTYTKGSQPYFGDWVQLETEVLNDNAVVNAGSLAYVTTPAVAQQAKLTDRQWVQGTTTAETGEFVWQPGNAPGIGSVNGYPAVTTANMDAGYILFGDWSQLIIADWNMLSIDLDRYGALFDKASVQVRAILDVDFGLRHGESFAQSSEAL